MAAVYMGNTSNIHTVCDIFRNMGEQISSHFECIGADLVDRTGAFFDVAFAEQLAVLCGGGAVADSYRILVFTAGAKVEIQVSIPL